jgi:hypothetical protein
VSIVTLPAGLPFGAGCGAGQRRYDLHTASDATGAGQARSFGPPRWTLSLISPDKLRPAEAALWEQVLVNLRGRLNHLAAHDPGKPAPVGTARGAMTLSAAAAIGATTLAVQGAGASTTLLAGDWLQLGAGLGTSQLVKVAANATATVGGAFAALAIEPPLRLAFGIGVAVTWDKPVSYYKLASTPGLWTYGTNGLQGGFALDLLEQWS